MMINNPATAIEFSASWIYNHDAVPWVSLKSALRAIRSAVEGQDRVLALSMNDRYSPETRASIRETRRTLVAMSLFAEVR